MKRVANFCPNCSSKLILKYHQGKDRPTCPECEYIVYFDPKVAVLALVIQADKVLLIKRGIRPGKGKWACPAGFVEHDEPPENAVLRELQEETGFIGKVERLIEIFPKKDQGLADIVIAYQVRITGGTLAADDDASDAGWFTRDNLPELVFYPSITLIGQRWRNYEL